MKNQFVLLIFVLLLTACGGETPPPAPTNTPEPVIEATDTPLSQPIATPTETPVLQLDTPLVISEVMAGDMDFIELYNSTTTPLNLKGYRVVYRLGTTEDDLPLYTFEDNFVLPGYHHALLALENSDVRGNVDALFAQQLNVKTGGVGLYNSAGELVDAVAWGKAPPLFTEGDPVPEMPQDSSLQRLPGGAHGNGADTNNNAADFTVSAPNPQSSTGGAVPFLIQPLFVRLDAPSVVEPGQSFEYRLVLENRSDQDLSALTIDLTLPAGLTIEAVEGDGALSGDHVVWLVDTLPGATDIERRIVVQAPWTYTKIRVDNYWVGNATIAMPVFGSPTVTTVEGGVIPIGVARTLPPGTRVTIEGTATMYTGGYYAGSGGTKFYVQDQTGGVQIFIDSGPLPEVQLGDIVRVSGEIEIYRDSVEIIPATLPDDIEFIGTEPALGPKPPLSVAELTSIPALVGQYVSLTGQATRIEEFAYNYEIDIVDEAGDLLMLYVDKETNLTTEQLNVGDSYTVAGILEFYQGQWQLKPRTADDFKQVYPPVLRLELAAPITLGPGEPLEYVLIAYNHTDAPLTDVTITSPIPGQLVAIGNGGEQAGDQIRWVIPTLNPSGASSSVRFSVLPQAGETVLKNIGAAVIAAEWPEPALAPTWRTFIGATVPVWAVQGEGEKSPYAGQTLTTEGVVTAIFDPADIPGFFIQEIETDSDPATSAGLFVQTESPPADLIPGDRVRVTGSVREVSGQTQLNAAEITIIESGVELPASVSLDPPQDNIASAAYYEALEGMLVSAAGIVVGPTSKYGETNLVAAQHGETRLLKGDALGWLITVDDNSWTAQHPDSTTLPYGGAVTGDQMTEIVGPLAYTYGQFKIQPVSPPTVIPGDFPRESTLPQVAATGFSLATYNVENFFDDKDPNPADPPRPGRAEYQHKAAKIAAGIAAMGYPTVVAFAEVENIDVLEMVAQQPALTDFDYQAVLIEGRDSRGIDVGYLVRGDRAEVIDAQLLLDDEGIFTRGPLLLQSNISTANGDITLYTLANHFVSLGAGFESTEPRRILQAQWNLDIAAEIQAAHPDALIAILGDLNTFYDAPSIDLLREAGFIHVFEQLLPEERYTYIYQGELEVLDHVLVSPGLADLLRQTTILHINADFPPADPEDESPRRTSDHDPVVVQFEVP